MMKRIQTSLILLSVVLLLGTLFSPTVCAMPYTLDGYVYVDGVLTTPDDIIFTMEGDEKEVFIPGEPYTGYYDVLYAFEASIGDEGTFIVILDGLSYEAEPPLIIDGSEESGYYENYNLTVDTSTGPLNNRPNTPTNPNPSDDATGVALNPALSVFVSDPDDDTMAVTFYDAKDDSVIGTDNEVINGTTASVTWSGLSNSETYSWYAIANDGAVNSLESNTWSFTTKSSSSGGGGSGGGGGSPTGNGGGSGDGGDIVGPGDNAKPTAVATVNMNTGSPGTEFSFDASDSSDPEGTDLNFTWNFDDGSIGYGETITHTFSSTGTYEVMLTVEDAGGLTDSLDEPLIIEIIVGNNPPTDVTITPDTTQTSVDTNVTFTISATDPDENDTIEYTINWDDTNSITSERYNSTESFEATHKWETYGVYDVTVTAKDEQNATNETTATVWVDVYVIDDEINGWLIDTNSDGTFDTFRNTETDQETDVEEQKENVYLIDADDDGTWDYTFNTETDTLKAYSTDQDDGLNLAVYVLVGLIILLIIVFGYLTYKNKQQQQKKQRQQKQEKKSSSKKSSKKSQSKKSKK